jgi:GAF domain-containing protein
MEREIGAQRARLEMTSQIELFSNAIIAIASDLDLESVLQRIVDIARQMAGAKYGAIGIPNTNGELSAFITSGLTPEQEAQIGRSPRGLGILGLLISDPRTLRMTNLSQHPASIGFPANHPQMESFLGVPIFARGRMFGSLYLTEKLLGSGFTDEDARMVELLAQHAGIAIANAEKSERAVASHHQLQQVTDQFLEAKQHVRSRHVMSPSTQESTLTGGNSASLGQVPSDLHRPGVEAGIPKTLEASTSLLQTLPLHSRNKLF